MKLTTRGVERLACVDAVQVAEACEALLARLRRIAQVASGPNSPRLSEACAAHTASAEALLNLLSVLREDGTQGAAVYRLERGLAKVLDGAASWFPAASGGQTE